MYLLDEVKYTQVQICAKCLRYSDVPSDLAIPFPPADSNLWLFSQNCKAPIEIFG